MTWIAFRFAVHQGPSPEPFPLLHQALARCAQVLPQPARSLPIHGGAHLHKAKSERCGFSRSSRLWLLLVKPAHIEQKGFRGGSRRRGQQIAFGDKSPRRGQNPSICEDSPPPSARLPWRAQQKPRPQPVESQDGRSRAARGLAYQPLRLNNIFPLPIYRIRQPLNEHIPPVFVIDSLCGRRITTRIP